MKEKERYLEILKYTNSKIEPFRIDRDDSNAFELNAYLELEREGYIKGTPSMEIFKTMPRSIVAIRSTLKGRLFQDQLEKEIREESFIYQTKKYLLVLLAFIAGLSPTFLQYLLQPPPAVPIVCKCSDPYSEGSQDSKKTYVEKKPTDEK